MKTALLLIGSAAFIFSCNSSNHPEEENLEGLMTQKTDSLIRIESTNGKVAYRFQTPLLEGYEYAKEPYTEFRYGIKIETFNDSTQMVESSLIGDYAIYYNKLDFWTVKGNVYAVNSDGQILETQQLHWNRKTGTIYSNVDSKIIEGDTEIIGEGFESDDQFNHWKFRRIKGRSYVDIEPNRDIAADDVSLQDNTGEETTGSNPNGNDGTGDE